VETRVSAFALVFVFENIKGRNLILSFSLAPPSSPGIFLHLTSHSTLVSPTECWL